VQLATEIFDKTHLKMLQDMALREAEGRFTIRGRIASLDVIETFGDDRRWLYLFGAGHVGRALVLALAPLPFDVQWVDSRPGAFPRAVPQNVTMLAPEDPASVLDDPASGSIALVMTHSHALDLALTDAALRNRRIAYVGLIGSATKRARFEKRLSEASVAPERIAGLICPIGLAAIRSKEPAMIAASTAAQLLALDEQLKKQEAQGDAAQWPHASIGGSQ
jgi:xanthine dehydrogenase accessory factor